MPRCSGRLALLALMGIVLCGAAFAEPFIVREGRAEAEIVIAEEPPRLVRLAAEELRDYVLRISGAELPIVTQPSAGVAARIYVGVSEHTERLGVDAEGLKYGAFRMVSGADWLALVGHDFDFEPREPWARSHGDRQRAQQEWEEMAGGAWGNPYNSVFRRRHGRTDTWSHDQGGSLNAVYAFLRSLGVRWYMPGELGEVVPTLDAIPLPAVDKTVRPDFPLRYWFGAYFVYTVEEVMWERRMGMNSGYETLGAGMHVHGMRLIHGREELQEKHPEYFALVGGERDTSYRGTGHACFSSAGMFDETVRFSRAVFDILDEPAVSVWPQDGYRQCQCELCQGKSASDLVWGFVDRVARELYETHPDRLVTCGAYAQYRTPPESINEFTPNVAVFISNRGRPTFVNEDRWQVYWSDIEAWSAKLAPGRIIRNENNRYTLAGDRSGISPVPFPALHPRAFAKDIRALKGVSLGEWNETARASKGIPGSQFYNAPGLDHLNLYVNSRFLWDAEQDLDDLLDEYYDLFYGPARDEMKAAFEYAETAYATAPRPSPTRIGYEERVRFLEMLHEARDNAGEDTIYGKRIQFVIDELEPLDELRERREVAQRRVDVPETSFTIIMDGEKWADSRDTLVLDGRLDERFWSVYGGRGTLRESVGGGAPDYGTTVRTRWYRDHLYFGIRCEDAPGDPANISTTEDGDPAIFDGDHVEILLETGYSAYYRLVVNPAGALLDMDMSEGEATRTAWTSNAEVAAHVGDGYWSVEVRIPVVGEEEGAMDPFHYVVGRRPSHHRSPAWPWHFNVGRVRIRGDEVEVSALSPTGSKDLQDRFKFASMLLRN